MLPRAVTRLPGTQSAAGATATCPATHRQRHMEADRKDALQSRILWRTMPCRKKRRYRAYGHATP